MLRSPALNVVGFRFLTGKEYRGNGSAEDGPDEKQNPLVKVVIFF